MKSMKNTILHEIFPESNFSWYQWRVQTQFSIESRLSFFMKSMKIAVLHGSMAKPSFCVASGICNSARRPRKTQFFIESWNNEIVHQVCEERSSPRKPKALQLVTKHTENAVLRGIHEEYNSSWVLWERQFLTKYSLAESNSAWSPRKNHEIHENHNSS